MRKLIDRNWLYLLKWYERTQDEINKLKIHKLVPVPDFECIRIRTLHLLVATNPKASKFTFLETLGLRVNLYSMVIENQKKQMKLLLEAPNRCTRQRPESSQKYQALLLNTNTAIRNFACR